MIFFKYLTYGESLHMFTMLSQVLIKGMEDCELLGEPLAKSQSNV